MMKGQNGITLVALIITIIVMLILVGVSISVAMNGGLFDDARDASRQTKQAQVSEAAALAKAELLSDFYSAKTDSAREKPSASAVEGKVNSYLDGINVTVTENESVYTITTEDVDYAADEEKPTIDLSDLTFATSESGTETGSES